MLHPTKKTLFVGLVVFSLGALSFAALQTGFHYTNRLDYCVSCHSMQVNFEEYKKSTHYKNASGMRTVCADCHIPKDFFPMLLAKTIATKDFYYELVGKINNPTKLEAHRWELANVVWKKMRADDSAACRQCHEYASMDMNAQDKKARNKHQRAVQNGKTCIDCHAGIVHEEPLEPEGIESVADNINPEKNPQNILPENRT